MADLDRKHYYIDFCGLCGIGLFSLGYIIFYSSFAELNIQFPFLGFPIFVGEILLFICLLLFLAKYGKNPPKLTNQHYLILGYFIFVFFKAAYGYLTWGPLALRNAALLYYPVFAVFGCVFFRKDFFGEWKCLVLFFLISIVFIGRHSEYWALTLVSLGFILIKSYPNKITKFLMSLMLFIVIPYKEFFQTSRMMIVSNFLSGLYLASMLPIVLNVNKKIKFGLTMLMGGVVIFGMFKMADRGAVKSIVAFKKMAEVIRTCDAYIESNSGHFKMEGRKEVRLYNPDKPARGDAKTSVNDDKKMTETMERQAKAELKEIIVKNVKEKIAGFSLGPVDKGIQREVKQEIESILDMQLPKEAQRHPAGSNSAHNVKNEIEPALAGTAPESIKTVMVGVQGKVRESGASEEANTIIRETFFKQVKQEIRMAPVRNILNGEKQQYAVMIDDVKREMQMAFTDQVKQNVPVVPVEESKAGWVENNNAVFRLLIWKDMLTELAREKPILGFSFGKPLRSISLEILDWGAAEWARDGWVAAHNSYLDIIYRAGMIGVLFIGAIFSVLFQMVRRFIHLKSVVGVLLCGIIINWFVAANFLLIFELPYTAIPLWSLYGMTFAYCYRKEKRDALER